ncbi:hypothetical protein ABR737_27295 [Streptomyces sp. Edi2]|uniref:hypothetical protein n=1 Tax=Streptomyces sp. Edi2 TaxID=3162528 RepID=UPI0033062D36
MWRQPGGQGGQELVAGRAARQPFLRERFEGRAVGGGQRHTGFGTAESGEGGVAGGVRWTGLDVGVDVWGMRARWPGGGKWGATAAFTANVVVGHRNVPGA